MLFAGNALAPGPQACLFAEKAIAKVKRGKHQTRIDFDIFNLRRFDFKNVPAF
jgi:hypothetical protein